MLRLRHSLVPFGAVQAELHVQASSVGLRNRAPQVFPLAAAFVGYVVLWNLSLQLNPVGFYQLAKILIAPAVIGIEAAFYAKRPTRNELLAVAVLCVGVTMATVTDDQARPPRRAGAPPRHVHAAAGRGGLNARYWCHWLSCALARTWPSSGGHCRSTCCTGHSAREPHHIYWGRRLARAARPQGPRRPRACWQRGAHAPARRAQVATNPVGLMVALLAVCCTAVYQIWAGSKQKELGAGSMQLMHQFAPHATGLLAALVLGVEPLGLPGPAGGGCARACADGPGVTAGRQPVGRTAEEPLGLRPALNALGVLLKLMQSLKQGMQSSNMRAWICWGCSPRARGACALEPRGSNGRRAPKLTVGAAARCLL